MKRRSFLRAASIVGATGVTGCLGDASEGSNAPPLVEDRPDAVYYPSHIEGMQMAGVGMAGDFTVGLSYSFPHRFWLATGQKREKVDIKEQDSAHLMATVWDDETNTVLPASNVAVDVTKGGTSVNKKRMWPMLSQNMGFHYGDNVALDGDGTYEAAVTVDPMGARRTGDFAGRFGSAASTTVEFEFSQSALEELMFRRLDEKKGQRGSVSPMEMEMMPVSHLPVAPDLPGSNVGEATSGDGVFLVRKLADPPAGIDAEGTYLALSPRTPYNRYPLPMMSLSAVLSRGGEAVVEDDSRPTLDPGLGYHYGAIVDTVESGDELELSVTVPPQVARHEGYETAFFDMPSMTLTAE
jgi:hypothetical protein